MLKWNNSDQGSVEEEEEKILYQLLYFFFFILLYFSHVPMLYFHNSETELY